VNETWAAECFDPRPGATSRTDSVAFDADPDLVEVGEQIGRVGETR
jgi:hypothetical protein